MHHLTTTALSTNDFNCQLCWALLWKSFIWDHNSQQVSPFLNLSLSCNFSDCCSFWSLCRNAVEIVKKGFSLTDQPREMTISLSLSPSLSLSIVLPLSLPSSVFFFRSFWQRLSINVSFSLIFNFSHRRVCLSFLLLCENECVCLFRHLFGFVFSCSWAFSSSCFCFCVYDRLQSGRLPIFFFFWISASVHVHVCESIYLRGLTLTPTSFTDRRLTTCLDYVDCESDFVERDNFRCFEKNITEKDKTLVFAFKDPGCYFFTNCFPLYISRSCFSRDASSHCQKLIWSKH